MKPSFRKNLSRHLIGTAAATIFFPLAIGWAGTAQATECSPLQVSSFQIFDSKPVKQGSTIVGVNFRVKTILVNTNSRRFHSGNTSDQATLKVIPAYRTQSPGNQGMLKVEKYPRGLAARTIKVFLSDRVTAMRNPNDLVNFTTDVEAHVYNADCDPGNQISHTKFKFDLNPILRGQKAKRLHGRIRGYSERQINRPVPRPGGAPRPRT